MVIPISDSTPHVFPDVKTDVNWTTALPFCTFEALATVRVSDQRRETADSTWFLIINISSVDDKQHLLLTELGGGRL